MNIHKNAPLSKVGTTPVGVAKRFRGQTRLRVPCAVQGGAFQILCRRSGRKAASISVLIANHQCIGDTDGIPDSEQPAARWNP
jgi:hypothetical protein